MVYRFGDYVLDTAKFELRKRGVRLGIEPQVLRLLQFLIENRDRVVSRSEIHRKLWGRRLVTDNALTGPPSIAVLPFECIGGDDVEENFARGLAHDLITRVARSRTMLIIARGSAFRFASGQHNIAELGNILGVRYVVQGAIQIANSRLKVFVASPTL